MSDKLKQEALEYHAAGHGGRPGKVGIEITKPCETQHELSLAYTPGVAAPVRAIDADAEAAYLYTAKGNLVAVITDGTAVLGLGNVGPLAGKPVMEGKGYRSQCRHAAGLHSDRGQHRAHLWWHQSGRHCRAALFRD
jgi:malate dehydrogenase (oxaloacetate-decarboxylating)(NADP+)